MQARTIRRAVVAAVAVFAVAATATVALRPAFAPTPMTAVATGEYVDGKPVYRLPAVNVTVSRKAELAKMAQEEEAVASAAPRR
ncbi:MAG: hypothetical protein U1F48_03580 [Burkholderiales bacterium]